MQYALYTQYFSSSYNTEVFKKPFLNDRLKSATISVYASLGLADKYEYEYQSTFVFIFKDFDLNLFIFIFTYKLCLNMNNYTSLDSVNTKTIF